jgi:Secretion system C-terminal sorting domain
MKSSFIFFSILLISLNGFSQGNLNAVWSYLTTPSKAEAWGVDIDNTGNVLWAVSSANTNIDLNITAYKFGNNGNLLWNPLPTVVDVGNQKAFIVKATDSVIYIGGHHCPPLGFGVNCPLLLVKFEATTGAYIDTFAFKYNNSFGYNEVDDIHLFNDGILLSGWAQTGGSSFQIEMGFMKITHNLDSVIWQNTFGQPNTAEHQDGHIVIDNNIIYACGMWGGTGIANLYDGQSLLAKFDLNGAVYVDSVLFGNSSPLYSNLENALGMTSDGNHLYVTGYTTVAANNGQIFLACFDKNLNLLWYNIWGGSSFESARAIEVSNGFVYVGGQSNSSTISSTGYDGVVLKYDTLGNFITYKKYSTQGNDEIRDMVIDGNFIYVSGASTLSDTSNQTEVAFLLKCDLNQLTSVEENVNVSTDVIVYPNPVKGIATISFTREQQLLSVEIFEYTGKKIEILENISLSQKITMDFTTQRKGIYIVKCKTEKGVWVNRIVKM